ncbi:hypothetical protein C1J03_21440 [Sulfitobacter sp. SK012]|nr:hypothetical protein C1J03_21440 [Sulfitobacter sp. SK012]
MGALCSALSIFVAPGTTHAEEGQSISSQASDPTASLMSFQVQNFYTPNLHNTDEEQNIVQFRSAIPFTLGGINNIARLTLPYVTQSASGATGFGDATVFNLAAFDRNWGRVGVGAVALLPTGADGVSAEKWGIGPAFGFVARPSWGLAGLFNQNILTVAGNDDLPDINISTVQPILSASLGEGWSFGASDMTVVYDWDRSKFTSLPLGMKVSKLTKISGLPVQFQVSYERNFYDEGRGPKDTIGFTVKLLVPK